MEKLIFFIVVWGIANVIAAIRFVLISGMNKKMTVFSLVMVNLIMIGIYIVYTVGLENINKRILIVFSVIVLSFMFYFYYKHDSKNKVFEEDLHPTQINQTFNKIVLEKPNSIKPFHSSTNGIVSTSLSMPFSSLLGLQSILTNGA